MSFVGFRNRQIPVSAFTDWNNIRIILRETVIQLDDVTVMSPSISEDFAVERLESIDIYLSPASGADPLKAVSVMAASTNVSESGRDGIFYLFSSFFYVSRELHGQFVFRHDSIHFRVVVSRCSENFQHFPHRVLLVLRPLGNLDDGFFPVLGTVQVCQAEER